MGIGPWLQMLANACLQWLTGNGRPSRQAGQAPATLISQQLDTRNTGLANASISPRAAGLGCAQRAAWDVVGAKLESCWIWGASCGTDPRPDHGLG